MSFKTRYLKLNGNLDQLWDNPIFSNPFTSLLWNQSLTQFPISVARWSYKNSLQFCGDRTRAVHRNVAYHFLSNEQCILINKRIMWFSRHFLQLYYLRRRQQLISQQSNIDALLMIGLFFPLAHCLDLDLYAHDRSHFHWLWFLVELEWDNWFLLNKVSFYDGFF